MTREGPTAANVTRETIAATTDGELLFFRIDSTLRTLPAGRYPTMAAAPCVRNRLTVGLEIKNCPGMLGSVALAIDETEGDAPPGSSAGSSIRPVPSATR